MVITFQGKESFKIVQGDLSLVLNPESKTAADITLFTSGGKEVSDKSGFVISGPGEYEVKGVSIKGFLSEGKDKKINTIYMMNVESIDICFLGSLSSEELSPEILEQLEDIDILFSPVSAYKLAVSLEPSIVIPMDYTPETLKKFLKEVGDDNKSAEEKLVIKKKDLEGKEGEVVILKQEL